MNADQLESSCSYQHQTENSKFNEAMLLVDYFSILGVLCTPLSNIGGVQAPPAHLSMHKQSKLTFKSHLGGFSTYTYESLPWM